MTGFFVARTAIAVVALAGGGVVADGGVFTVGRDACESPGADGAATWRNARRARLSDMRARGQSWRMTHPFDNATVRMVWIAATSEFLFAGHRVAIEPSVQRNRTILVRRRFRRKCQNCGVFGFGTVPMRNGRWRGSQRPFRTS